MPRHEPPPASVPLDAVAFLADKRAKGRAAATIATYGASLRRLVAACGSPVDLVRLDAYAGDAATNPATRRYDLDTLRTYIVWAKRRGIMPDTFVPLPDAPAVPKREPRVWSAAEWAAFKRVALAAPQPARGVLGLLIGGALRTNELTTLSRGQVAEAVRLSTLAFTRKGNKPGSVPITGPYAKAARGLLDIAGWKHVGDLVGGGDALRRRKAVLALVAWACAEAGFERGTTHEIRHCVAVEMLRAGATLEHVRRMLGHEGFRSLKYYTELDGTDLMAFRT